MQFDTKLRDLIVAEARSISKLLNHTHEYYWENILNRGIRLLEEDKFESGIQLFKQMYGGMGSVNDLYISPMNGHNVAGKDIHTVNLQLSKYLSNLYQLIHS